MIAEGPGATASTHEDRADAPITVAVLGSCITRDNFNRRFNPGYRAWYRTVLMHSQSSVISVMAAPSGITDDEIGDAKELDRRTLHAEFSKSFLDTLTTTRPDYLIVDFFGDARFGCLDLGDGRFVTNNRWLLWPTPWFRERQARGGLRAIRMDRDPEPYFERWTEAFDRFAATVRRTIPDTRVVIHHGRDTDSLLLPGTSTIVPLQAHRAVVPLDVPLTNALWARLDRYAATTTGWASIDLTDRDYPTFDGHPWGPYYGHFTMDYYADFLRALNAIHLRSALVDRQQPYLVDMLAATVQPRVAPAYTPATDSSPTTPAATTHAPIAGAGRRPAWRRVARGVRSHARRVFGT